MMLYFPLKPLTKMSCGISVVFFNTTENTTWIMKYHTNVNGTAVM